MTETEENSRLSIGSLVLEQSDLGRRISALRDELAARAKVFARAGKLLLFQPERLVFDGQTVSEKFSGEPVIDRKAMEVNSLLDELRSAIIRQGECSTRLAEMGIDLEENERQQNLRASRALFHPANVHHSPNDDSENRVPVGFGKPPKPEDERSR